MYRYKIISNYFVNLKVLIIFFQNIFPLWQVIPTKSNRLCTNLYCNYSRSGYRNSVRLFDHRLRQEPLPQAAAVLIRHPGFRPVWGYGSVLSYDGLPAAVRFLSYLLLRTLLPSNIKRFQCILSGVGGHGIECVETSPHSDARTDVYSVTLTSASSGMQFI